MTPPTPTAVTRSAEEFFWAVIETPTTRPTATDLAARFAHVLPTAPDDVHVVYRRLDDRRHLACGLPRTALQNLPDQVDSLHPSDIPLDTPTIRETDLNMLVGDFTPPAIRRLRRHVLLIVAITGFGVVLGTTWRWRSLAATYRAATAESRQSVGRTPLAPRLQQLTAHLDDLPDDQFDHLARILGDWPPGLDLDVTSITIADDHLAIQLPGATESQRTTLQNALDDVVTWMQTAAGGSGDAEDTIDLHGELTTRTSRPP